MSEVPLYGRCNHSPSNALVSFQVGGSVPEVVPLCRRDSSTTSPFTHWQNIGQIEGCVNVWQAPHTKSEATQVP